MILNVQTGVKKNKCGNVRETAKLRRDLAAVISLQTIKLW
ncbi:unnamed protein product, partial [Rotaria sordida]